MNTENTKPDWKDAPEWAYFLAMDHDRKWYWYEYMPMKTHSMWNPLTGRIGLAKDFANNDWENSLENRPPLKTIY